jgi:hypothetical protein
MKETHATVFDLAGSVSRRMTTTGPHTPQSSASPADLADLCPPIDLGGTMAAVTLADLPQRVRDIAALRGLGYSFREIAGHMEVTPQAVSLMLARHRRALQRLGGATDLANLSTRAVNVLGRHRVTSRAEAIETNLIERLQGERNCGRKTLGELRSWIENACPRQHSPTDGRECMSSS